MTLDEWLTLAADLGDQPARLAWLRANRAAVAAEWLEQAKAQAESLGYAGDLDGALRLIEAVYPVALALETREGEALLLRARANVLQYHERYEECLAISAAAVAIYQALGQPKNVAVAQMVQVGALGALERFDEALALAGQIRPIFEAWGSKLALGRLANAEGRVYTALWQLDDALPKYEAARQLYLEDNQPKDAAWVLHNIGHLYARKDDPRRAEAILTQAYQEFVAVDDLISAVKCRFNLARVMIAQARFKAALGHLDAARDHLAQLAAMKSARGQAEESPDAGYVDQLEADVRDHLHDSREAEELLRRALARFDRLERKLETAETQVKLALLLVADGSPRRMGEGLELLEQAIRLLSGLRVPLFTAWVRMIQAETLLRRQRRPDALAAAREAAAAFRDAGLRLRLAQALVVQGDCSALTEPEEAARLYRDALALIGPDAALLAVRCWHGLGRLALDARDAAPAEAAYRQAATILDGLRTALAGHAQKARFLENKQAIYEELLSAILAQPGREESLLERVERQKASALAELLLDRPPDPSTDAQVRALMAERNRLADLLDQSLAALDPGQMGGVTAEGQGGPTLAAHDGYYARQVATLRRRLRAIEEDIIDRRDPATEWRSVAAIAPDGIHDLLDEHTGLVAYFTTRDGLLAALTVGHAPGDVKVHSLRVRAADLVMNRQLGDHRVDATGYLADLYNRLLRPLERRLEGKSRLIILPHRQLFLLPFAAFFDSRRGEYAIQRWAMQLAPSATVIAWCGQRQPAGRGALLVGYPGQPDQPQYLEGVGREIEQLAGLLPRARRLFGPDATEENLMEWLAGNEIIHLAGHAYFDAHNPMESGMPLMGGHWLRAADLFLHYGLLDGATVVLSGCQTGQGEPAGSEVLGLISAFFYAGARGVVSSLWKVDDAATAVLMGHFYDGLARGRATAEALRQAQLALLGSDDYRRPYYWGAFQLAGAEQRFDFSVFRPG